MSPEQPDQPTEHISVDQPPARRKRRWWLLAIAAVVLAGAAWLTVWLLTPDTFTVNGSIKIEYPCSVPGYSDISDGAQVEIVNQRNEVLAVGHLAYQATCAWSFYANDVPAGENLYGVRIGNQRRGVVWKTEDEARKVVTLTLG